MQDDLFYFQARFEIWNEKHISLKRRCMKNVNAPSETISTYWALARPNIFWCTPADVYSFWEANIVDCIANVPRTHIKEPTQCY